MAAESYNPVNKYLNTYTTVSGADISRSSLRT